MRRTLAWITMSLLLAGLAPTLSIADDETLQEFLPLINGVERMSSMGKVLDIEENAAQLARYDAFAPAVARNPHRDVLMMVWHGDNNAAADIDADENEIPLVDGEFEIWGRQVDARNATGNANIFLLDNMFRISLMGDEDEKTPAERRRYQAFEPDIAFDANEDQFLVVWRADDNTDPLVDDEYEIWGRLYAEPEIGLSPATPAGDPFRITTIGDDSENDPAVRARFGAYEPHVEWDPTTGNYLLVYRSNDPAFGLAEDEYEIFGQRLNSKGKTVGAPFRISTMGDDSETDPAVRANYIAEKPAIAWNGVAEQFLVAWQGDDNTGGLVDDEFEIYTSTITPGGNASAQQRISAMGPDGDANYDALDPDIAVNTSTGDYMVAWSGDDDTGGMIDGEFEIHVSSVSPGGSVSAQVRVSTMGPDGDANYDAEDPSIAWHEGEQRFMVSWRGDDNTAPFVEDEFQVFAQSVNPDRTLYEEHFRVSNNNLDGFKQAEKDPAERRKRDAHWPASIYAGGSVYHLWSADGPARADDEHEIFAQRTSWVATTVLAEGMRYERGSVPDPITVEYKINNVGSQQASNVAVRYWLSHEFDIDWTGCTPRVAENYCDIGNIAPGDSATVIIELDTSDRKPGDNLGTFLDLAFVSDTALVKARVDVNDTPDDASDDRIAELNHGDFVSAILELESGGAGALLPLVPFLLLLWSMVARRHRD